MTAPPSLETALSGATDAFIADMVTRHGFGQDELEALLDTARLQPSILKAISVPISSVPWYEYRPRFINPKRIAEGIAFCNQHAVTLSHAHKVTGVPEKIIAGIIGIETLYGTRTGQYRVLDALTTLAFNYPRRADFFKGELENYLLLMREQGPDLINLKGSYAGAIGIPQFMPGSYRQYAVDFDGDGKKDLSQSVADAIGSIGHYLGAHGWTAGQEAVIRARVEGDGYRQVLEAGIKPSLTIAELKKLGIIPLQVVADDQPAALFMLETKAEPEYWLGLNNFYVITRYNRSVYYAMSVLQLADALDTACQPRPQP